jgi:hypothetical protein
VALSDTQRKLLTYGVPIVAAVALLVFLRSRSSAATPSTATATGTVGAGDTAVGLDQIASFENAVQGQIQGLANLISTAPATPVAAATTAPPAGPSLTSATAVAPPVNPVPRIPSPSVSQLSVGGTLYNHISGPSQLTPLFDAGQTIYAVESGVPIAVASQKIGTNVLSKLPTGTALYVRAP